MSIYTELLDAVDNGKKFKIDLVNKSLWINRKQIIKEGEIVHEGDKSKDLINEWDLALHFAGGLLNEDTWSWIEFLYNEYKYSAPSKNSNKKSYFKALPVEKLSDTDLAYGSDRDYAQAMLEGYILFGSLVNWIQWENDNHWFWQGEDKDLVLLKEWVKRGN